jgi:hypothetical protein
MAKVQKPAIQNPDRPPIFYADQPASVVYGPHVTRITFGVAEDDGSDYPRPVVTIAMPTLSLLRFVKDLSQRLGTEEYKSDMVNGLQETLAALTALDTSATE